MKILAIHQPDFLPYTGFFYKLDKCDKFLVGDYYSYSNNGYIQRVKLGGEWLTEMVVDKKSIELATPISQIKVDAKLTYERIISALDKHLKDAPNYRQVKKMIVKWFETLQGRIEMQDYIASLTKVNMSLIECICEYIGIDYLRKVCYLEGDKPDKVKGECIVEIMKRQFPDYAYLSGAGGKSYIKNEFSDAGIELMFSDHNAKYSDSILAVLAYEDDPIKIIRNKV